MLNLGSYRQEEILPKTRLGIEMIASQFAQHRIRKQDVNCFVYDTYEEVFNYKGLPPVQTFGPSFRKLGQALAAKLIAKWETGKFAEPLLERI